MRPSDPIIIEEMSSPVNRIVSSGALLSHQSLEPKCWGSCTENTSVYLV